jgi:hypothetical protein
MFDPYKNEGWGRGGGGGGVIRDTARHEALEEFMIMLNTDPKD